MCVVTEVVPVAGLVLNDPRCPGCETKFDGAHYRPWQFHCGHIVCQLCHDATIYLAEQEECFVCLKPAFPSAMNLALEELLGALEADVEDVEEVEVEVEGRPLKRVCSEVVSPASRAWAEHIASLDAAAVECNLVADVQVALLMEEHAALQERMLARNNRLVSEARTRRNAVLKEIELMADSAAAHVRHIGLPGCLPVVPTTIPVLSYASQDVKYAIHCQETRYCAVQEGRSPLYCVRGAATRWYGNYELAIRELQLMRVASVWFPPSARVGDSAYVNSTFQYLDTMKLQLTPSQIEGCINSLLPHIVDDTKVAGVGTDPEARGFAIMLPFTPYPITCDASLLAALPKYDPSRQLPQHLPADSCFCGTIVCKAPVL